MNTVRIIGHSSILFFILFVLASGCEGRISKEDELRLYNDIIDQIVYDNYYQSCLEESEVVYKDFLSGRISEAAYLKIVDSLKAERKKNGPRCTISFRNHFGILGKNQTADTDVKFSLQQSLNDDFLSDVFNSMPNDAIDKLLSPASISLNDLKIEYLNIVPDSMRTSLGHGVGTLIISKVCFNESLDKGILYYEFSCGSLCGHGQIILVGKEKKGWSILKYKRVWDN